MDFAAALRRVTKWPPISTSFLVPQEAPPPPDPLRPYEAKPFRVVEQQFGEMGVEPRHEPWRRGSLFPADHDPRLLRRRQ